MHNSRIIKQRIRPANCNKLIITIQAHITKLKQERAPEALHCSDPGAHTPALNHIILYKYIGLYKWCCNGDRGFNTRQELCYGQVMSHLREEWR